MLQGMLYFQGKEASVEYSKSGIGSFVVSNDQGDEAPLSLRKGYRFRLKEEDGHMVTLIVTEFAKDVQETTVLLKAQLEG